VIRLIPLEVEPGRTSRRHRRLGLLGGQEQYNHTTGRDSYMFFGTDGELLSIKRKIYKTIFHYTNLSGRANNQ
jgi:hypothetical protein